MIGIASPRPARIQQFTTPPLNENLRVSLKTCTAIHVGVSSVTWTQLRLEPQSRTVISNWASFPITDKKIQMYELVNVMWPIIDEIPDSDIYLLETPRIAMATPQGTPAQTNINIQLSQTIAMISLAMANRCRVKNVPKNEISSEIGTNSGDALRTTETGSKKTLASETPTAQLLFLRQYLASRYVFFVDFICSSRLYLATTVPQIISNCSWCGTRFIGSDSVRSDAESSRNVQARGESIYWCPAES